MQYDHQQNTTERALASEVSVASIPISMDITYNRSCNCSIYMFIYLF